VSFLLSTFPLLSSLSTGILTLTASDSSFRSLLHPKQAVLSILCPKHDPKPSRQVYTPLSSFPNSSPPLLPRNPLTRDDFPFDHLPLPPYLDRLPPQPDSDSTTLTLSSFSPRSTNNNRDSQLISSAEEDDTESIIPSALSSVYHPHSREASISRLAIDPMSSEISFAHLLRFPGAQPTPSFTSRVSSEEGSLLAEKEEEDAEAGETQKEAEEAIYDTRKSVEEHVRRPSLVSRSSEPTLPIQRRISPPLVSIEGTLSPPKRAPFGRSRT